VDREAEVAGGVGERLEDVGLTDPGLAHDHRHRTTSIDGPTSSSRQRRPFGPATDHALAPRTGALPRNTPNVRRLGTSRE
jgi:hypothetical protein